MILFGAEAIFALGNSKSGPWMTLAEHEDFKSSTESTKSTSLIHCIAPVGNCEQVHTSVLNLIFQQAKFAGVRNLSKWKSEICSRCWSVPWFFEESLPLKMTESLADGPDWHLWSRFFSGLSLFSAVVTWSGSSIDEFHWSILENGELMLVDLQKCSPMHHACPKCFAACRCDSTCPQNGSSFDPELEKVWITHVDLERWMIHYVLIQHFKYLSNHSCN